MKTLIKRPRDDFFGLDAFFRSFDDVISSFENSLVFDYDHFHKPLKTTKKVSEDGLHTLSLPVPGYSKSDLKVTICNGVLSVTGKNKASSVSYSETINPRIDSSTISAECKDGILILSMKEKELPVINIEVK